jgi:hypothetical protein
MALFTLLDGGLPPSGQGLVSLRPQPVRSRAAMTVSRFEVDQQ